MLECVLIAGQLWISDPSYEKNREVALVAVNAIGAISPRGVTLNGDKYLYFDTDWGSNDYEDVNDFINALKSCPNINNGEPK